jgi:hypothetical protein
VWDAPVTDDAVWIDVPRDDRCMYCGLQFADGDNGCIYPTGLATHRECALRAVHGGIGHLVDHERYCYGERDPDAGLTKRQSSVLVWRHVVDKLPVGEAELELASS